MKELKLTEIHPRVWLALVGLAALAWLEWTAAAGFVAGLAAGIIMHDRHGR